MKPLSGFMGSRIIAPLMIKHILHTLAAVLVGCGLVLAAGCNSKDQQLKSAVDRINEACPSAVAEGISFQQVRLVEGDINMTFTIQEDAIGIPVTSESVKEWKEPFVTMFAALVYDNADVARLFHLIGDTQSTMTVTISTLPSGATYPLQFSHDDINRILSADKLPTR